MSRFNNPLDRVKVASPCKADWAQMIGTERVRFCGQCNLNVYNLSSMTKMQAESLIADTEGRLCVRFYRRADGSILTRDCPVGLRAIRRRLAYLAKAASAAILSFLAGLGVYKAVTPAPISPRMGVMVETVGEVLISAPTPEQDSHLVVKGELTRLPHQNHAGKKATRRRDK